MPTPELKAELEKMGLSSSGVKPCPKCRMDVEWWEKQSFNLDSHPTAPLMLHLTTCGETLEDAELPSIKGLEK